jgi:hypothetical protein
MRLKQLIKHGAVRCERAGGGLGSELWLRVVTRCIGGISDSTDCWSLVKGRKSRVRASCMKPIYGQQFN